MQSFPQHISDRLRTAKVLVVDDEFYSRKVIRTLLTAIGVTKIYDAETGARGLEAIRLVKPDVVLVDWEMPNMDGAAFARAVRAPDSFPYPDVPLIMLTGHSERWRVEEAMKLGVNEYLVKPVSGKMMSDHLVATLTKPRPIVRVGNYYGPEPRRTSVFQPANETPAKDDAKDIELSR